MLSKPYRRSAFLLCSETVITTQLSLYKQTTHFPLFFQILEHQQLAVSPIFCFVLKIIYLKFSSQEKKYLQAPLCPNSPLDLVQIRFFNNMSFDLFQ